MRDITTSIEIDAKPDRVWKHLAAFSAYKGWNPFITALEGELALDGKISATLRLQTGDERGQFNHALSARIIRLEHEHEIRWSHGLWIPGLLRTEHCLRIAPRKGGVKFHQNMRVTGLLSHSLKDEFFTPFLTGFAAMNKALKERVEMLENAPRLTLAVANDNAGKSPPPLPGARSRNVG